MSSHREAPGISKDPVADSTDLYAFTSPDHPDTVTLIANYIPLEGPDGGPNFYNFGDDVLYEINVTNGGSVADAITYQFKFTTEYTDPNTFLYNTGVDHQPDQLELERAPVLLGDADPARHVEVLASQLACPPVNVGVRSTPELRSACPSGRASPDGGWVFAGQRREGFYVDLGSIFDLGALAAVPEPTPDPAPGGRRRRLDASSSTCTRSPSRSPRRISRQNGEMPTDATSPDFGHRRLHDREPAQVDSARQRRPHNRRRAVGPGLTPRHAADQRGGHPHRQEGLLELDRARERRAVRGQLRPSRARGAATGPLPGRFPAPRGVHQASRRPRGDPAHRHPGGNHHGLPELDRRRRRPTCSA